MLFISHSSLWFSCALYDKNVIFDLLDTQFHLWCIIVFDSWLSDLRFSLQQDMEVDSDDDDTGLENYSQEDFDLEEPTTSRRLEPLSESTICFLINFLIINFLWKSL